MIESPKNSFFEEISYRTTKNLQYFWFGFVLYSAGYALGVVGINVGSLVAYFQLLGLMISIPMAFVLVSNNIENNYLKAVYALYALWILTVIFRGFVLKREFLEQMVFEAYTGLFLYFVPIIILFPRKLAALKIVFDAIFVMSSIYFIYVLLNINELLFIGTNIFSQAKVEYFSKTLSIPSGFIIFGFIYHSDKKKLWALFIIVLTFVLAVIRARRGLMFMTSSIIAIYAIIYFFKNKGNLLKRFLPLIVLPILIMLLFDFYSENKSGLFSLITERGDEDTRTGVELYFYADMTLQDWIIGKGINGHYYCPVGFDINDEGIKDYRFGVETDYLTIILKGGIISLGLLMLIAIPAVIKGLFYSKNLLSKVAALWILLWLINLYPTTVTTFTMNYFLVWISIGICYSSEIRNLSEESIVAYFKQ